MKPLSLFPTHTHTLECYLKHFKYIKLVIQVNLQKMLGKFKSFPDSFACKKIVIWNLIIQIYWNHKLANIRPLLKTMYYYTTVSSYYETSQQCAPMILQASIGSWIFGFTSKHLTFKTLSHYSTVLMFSLNQFKILRGYFSLSLVGDRLTSDKVELYRSQLLTRTERITSQRLSLMSIWKFSG